MQTLNKLFSLSRILTVLLLLTLFAGCSDDDKGSTGSSCGTCHSPYGEAGGIDLTNGYYTINPKEIGWNIIRSADCLDKYAFIEPGEPMKSALLMAVASGYDKNVNCNSAYNYHATQNATISGSELNNLVDWINKQH